MNRQGTYAERVSKGGGDDFEVVDALGVGLFVDAVERGDALAFEIVRHALLAESMNSSIRR